MTLIDRGKNMTALQAVLLEEMDAEDATRLINKAKMLWDEIPNPSGPPATAQGLLLGLIQSGKTAALITSIALAADNGYKLFVVLTSDNLLLYQQTIDRLNENLPALQIAGKEGWDEQIPDMMFSLRSPHNAVVLVATKNATVLANLLNVLAQIQRRLATNLPAALIIDDEADQASLDTQTSKRANNPAIEPGRINDLITQVRSSFPLHAYLQVTATPQALFLQDLTHAYRPEFTILIEPGKGYVGGQDFFSLVSGQSAQLIRPIEQFDVDTTIVSSGNTVPDSLQNALCTFFVGATIKSLIASTKKERALARFSFLCHLSEKKDVHTVARVAISSYYMTLRQGLAADVGSVARLTVEAQLRSAYNDLLTTLRGDVPDFDNILKELQSFITSTDIQILNSDRPQNQPQYSRRYNIFIGGTKLARGVTIKNLIVTYYGREPRTANMDTMLQHARMYGYREKHLDVTRLFVTADIERRFRLINESEEALREVIEKYPNEIYRGIVIGQGVRATRRNVLNPNNVGAFGAGKSYFPHLPIYQQPDVVSITAALDQAIGTLVPSQTTQPLPITVTQAMDILKLTKSDPSGGGLWEDERILAALEIINREMGDQAYLVVRRMVDVQRNPGIPGTDVSRAVLAGGEVARAVRHDGSKPILFMMRLIGQRKKNWDEYPLWVPNLRFPDGQYGIMFNFE